MKTRGYWLIGAMAVLGLIISAVPARANTITLTFEGLQDEEPIENYYNGGTGGFGSSGGPNYGISFDPNALAIISGANGGSGNFSGSPSGDTIAFFLSGTGDLMEVPAGFTTGFSFFYSAVVYPGSVTVYSGLGGTGSVLATLTLPVTPSGGAGCTYGAYCPWFPEGVTFAGTAESVSFAGTANYIGFDNITLGSATPGGSTPEPTTMLLLGTGLGVAAIRRRLARR